MAKISDLEKKVQQRNEKLQKAIEEKKALAEREAKLKKELAGMEEEIRQMKLFDFTERLEKEGINLQEIDLDKLDYSKIAETIFDMVPEEKVEPEAELPQEDQPSVEKTEKPTEEKNEPPVFDPSAIKTAFSE